MFPLLAIVGKAVVGAVVGATVSAGAKAVFGSGGSSSSGSGGQAASPPKSSLADIKGAHSKTGLDILKAPVAKAQTAKVPGIKNDSGLLEDPWQPMKDWYDDLGGDSTKLRIDDTMLP